MFCIRLVYMHIVRIIMDKQRDVYGTRYLTSGNVVLLTVPPCACCSGLLLYLAQLPQKC